ncbi:MAG: acyl--CoA ligase [Alphaproteobacteria bacterium]|nr:acyl--CoA ligase [Alphaproteobacteria bacterium]
MQGLASRQFGGTIPRILECAVSASPDMVAATLGDRSITYRDCARATARLAHALSGWGVNRVDRIVYWADISLDAIDLFFALSWLGAVFVPANPAFSAGEFDAVLEYVRPAFVVTDAARQEAGQAAALKAGARHGVLGGEGGAAAGFDLRAAALRASDVLPANAARPGDANVFFLTSGSTGRPKATVISHHAHYLRAAGSQAYDSVCGGRGTACMFPLFHMAGWYMILQAFGRRRPIHLTRKASADELWDIIERRQPHELYCIPAVWRRILESAGGRDGSCLNTALTGTSRVELDLLEEIRGRFPQARNGIYYGSTEMGVSLGIGHDDIARHPYSVGVPMPNVETRVVDGELWLRADTAMDGYFGLPQETAEVFADGWYRSGDLVSVDESGFYEIVGRRREIIRSGGETIAPAEVEAAIAELAEVEEVAVIGLPDDAWGEIVCAVIVPHEGGAAPGLEYVRSRLEGRLAGFKHPRRIELRDERLPRTGATGQIQRARIQRELIAKMNRPADSG